MARLGVKKEDVFAICEELKTAKPNFTVKDVREKLGGTGSFSTISAHVKEWKQETSEKPLIPEPSTSFQVYFQKIWETAYTEASRDFNTLKTDLENENRKIKHENEEAILEIKSQEEKLEELEKTNMSLEESLEKLKGSFRKEKDELSKKVIKLEATLEAKDKELLTMSKTYESLEKLIKGLVSSTKEKK